MSRIFSKQQRLALFEFYQGKCAICFDKLDSSFHADHIIPYSKGGKTDVLNGQALCAACNLKKGNKMENVEISNDVFQLPKSKLYPIRDWQKNCLGECIRMIGKGEDSFLVNACPGAGKTILALTLAKYLIEQGRIDRIVVVSPSNNVKSGWVKSAHEHFNLQLKDDVFSFGDERDFIGMSITYQAAASQDHRIRAFTAHFRVLAIFDEMHHCSEGETWGKRIFNALENSVFKFILTGTPWTSTGRPIPFVKYTKEGELITGYDYHIGQAIKDEVCRIPIFHSVDIDEVLIHDSKECESMHFNSFTDCEDQQMENKLYELCRKGDGAISKLFLSADKELDNLRSSGVSPFPAGLIVADGIETAKKYQQLIYDLSGERAELVHSGTKLEDGRCSQEAIERFRKSTKKWLIAVDMVSEGVDIPRLQVLIFLQRKMSKLFFMQVLGREIRRIFDRKSEHEQHVDKFCYFYMLKHSALVQMAKEVEDIIKIVLDEPDPKPRCQVCGNRPNYKGCGADACPYPGVGPGPSAPRYELESESYSDHNAIAEGQEYSSLAVRIVEEACQRNHGKRIDRPSMLMAIEYALKMQSQQQTSDADDIPLAEKKSLIKRKINSTVRKITVYRQKLKGQHHQSENFAEIQYKINRMAGISSVSKATYEQLESALEIATTMLRVTREELSEANSESV